MKPMKIVMMMLFLCAPSIWADEVDRVITEKMRENNITGLSLAIIQDDKIEARGYGFTDNSHQIPVTPTTLFQAGSISKSVAAFGALHLVQEGKLPLDTDVNTELLSWKVPENEFTQDKKVTLRGVLSHSAGLTVHGFAGYARSGPVPTLIEVLNGARPANSSPIRVNVVPGTLWRYSGGGYVVMQQMIMDVTKESFPQFMSDTVLEPLSMTNSTYEQPLPRAMSSAAAAGYYADGSEVPERWHVYPEMAPAGLWTTASDLARFAISVQQAYTGVSNPVLSQKTVRQMLIAQNPSLSQTDGLGVFVRGSGKTFRFWHDGRNAGFDALMIEFPNIRKGAVIMINANDDKGSIDAIVGAIAKEYDWFGPASSFSHQTNAAEEKAATTAAQKWLAEIDSGQYSQSWQDASVLFQGKVPEQTWETNMVRDRKPLGTLISRNQKSSQYATQLPDAPNGQYVLMQFDTSFANKPSAIETVTFMLEKDGQWKSIGYFIR
jgi:CubicO group peptidase (beta-lactamase class C family)